MALPNQMPPAPVLGNSNEGFSVGKPVETNYNTQIQRGAQQNMPFRPNNGNPRGANNMPRFHASGFPMGGPPRPFQPNEVQPDGSVAKPGQQGAAPQPQFNINDLLAMFGQGGQFNFGGGGMMPNFNRQYYSPFGNFDGMGGGYGGYFGGQAEGVGRYRPPMMDQQGGWMGGNNPYNYNLPNAFGSYPGYGQGNPMSQFFGYGYQGMYGPPPRPRWG